MFTDVQIINLGLSKFASSQITRINPPGNSLERHMSVGYTHWKRTELTKRRWVFATVDDYQMTLTNTLTTGVRRPYVYNIPTNCLRPIREKNTEWKQLGRTLQSECPTLTIDYINDVLEANFDPLFVEVLACRIAQESVEFVTQSNVKRSVLDQWYEDAIDEAGKANAFVIGPENVHGRDEDYPFLAGRFSGNLGGN